MKPIHILLVEDNEGDIMLTTEALEDSNFQNSISVVKDGKEALDFLNKQGPYGGAEYPDLILLDINLPKKNGHEVLKYIKTSEVLKGIPVIMLTTSSSEKDISECYKNNSDFFITKPVEAADFMGAVAKIDDFWNNLVNSGK